MTRRLDFTDHRRELDQNRYIYAVVSRRAGGLSIGINLNPDKACNFDCPYCQVDRTGPKLPGKVDVPTLSNELDRLLSLAHGDLWSIEPFNTAPPTHQRIADIAFAGDGEPTANLAFADATRAVQEVRNAQGFSHIPIRLLTNATLLDRPRTQAGLLCVDELWCKLDAGTEKWYHNVDGTKFPFSKVLANLEQLIQQRPLTIQSMFCRIQDEEPDEAELQAWAEHLKRLNQLGTLTEVQVYTTARKPASDAVQPMPRPWLDAVGERVRSLGIPARVA